MKKILTFILCFIAIQGVAQIQGQTLCDEVIALRRITYQDSILNNWNQVVASNLKFLLTNSDKVFFASRDKLGELASFFESEKILANNFNQIPPEYLKQLLKNDITYLCFINSAYKNQGDLIAGISKMEFYSTYQGLPKILIELPYTVDEMNYSEAIIRKRLEGKLKRRLDCNKFDKRISDLKRKMISLEKTMDETIEDQIDICDDLMPMIEVYRVDRKFNRKYADIFKILEKQGDSCNGFVELANNLIKTQDELDTAIAEREARIKIYRRTKGNSEVNDSDLDNSKEDEESNDVAFSNSDYEAKIGESVRPQCYNKKPYYIVTAKEFSEKCTGLYFIQFATLPISGYKECEFNLVYNKIGEEYNIYLLNRGAGVSPRLRYRSLIGPFKSQAEAQMHLYNVRSIYSDAYLYNCK